MTEGTERTAPVHQRVGWFELFYDLVIVAAVGHGAHVFGDHPTWGTGAWIAVTFLVMFLLWFLTVLVNNTVPGDHPGRRLLVLVQMLALVVAYLSVGREEGLPDSVGFIALAVAFGSVALMYALAGRVDHRARADARLVGASTGAAAVILLLGAGAAGPWGGRRHPRPPAPARRRDRLCRPAGADHRSRACLPRRASGLRAPV